MDAEIHFFHCGNGDTILIRGGKEWALVDANLTISSGARERLLNALPQDELPRRLRFVCITHFDEDHIRGLGSFLRDHFGPQKGGRREWQIEQVILPIRNDVLVEFFESHREVFVRIRGEEHRAESPLTDLLSALFEIYNVSLATFCCYEPGTKLISLGHGPASMPLGPWEVAFLGPSRAVEDRYAVAFREKWGLSTLPRSQWPRKLRLAIGRNETSRIVALRHRVSGDTVLLTGDAPATSIAAALREWENLHAEETSEPGSALRQTFRVVKASHHGAYTTREDDNCHHAPLYHESCLADRSHVVISCHDHDASHPHEEVLVCVRGARLECRSTGAQIPHSIRPPRRGIGPRLGSPRRSTGRDVVVSHNEHGFSIEGGYIR